MGGRSDLPFGGLQFQFGKADNVDVFFDVVASWNTLQTRDNSKYMLP